MPISASRRSEKTTTGHALFGGLDMHFLGEGFLCLPLKICLCIMLELEKSYHFGQLFKRIRLWEMATLPTTDYQGRRHGTTTERYVVGAGSDSLEERILKTHLCFDDNKTWQQPDSYCESISNSSLQQGMSPYSLGRTRYQRWCSQFIPWCNQTIEHVSLTN